MLTALHITVQENVIDVKVLKMFKYKSLKNVKTRFFLAAETIGIYRFVMSFSKSGMVLHVHHPGTVRLQQEDCH